jgi:hypothetical protein
MVTDEGGCEQGAGSREQGAGSRGAPSRRPRWAGAAAAAVGAAPAACAAARASCALRPCGVAGRTTSCSWSCCWTRTAGARPGPTATALRRSRGRLAAARARASTRAARGAARPASPPTLHAPFRPPSHACGGEGEESPLAACSRGFGFGGGLAGHTLRLAPASAPSGRWQGPRKQAPRCIWGPQRRESCNFRPTLSPHARA